LDEGGIAYVIVGPHERALGSFDPGGAPYLALRDQSGDYAVYAVVR